MNNQRPKVLIVGTFHFEESPDMIQTDTGDIFSQHRQKEVLLAAEKIAEFKPTKVAVEAVKAEEDALNKTYEDYLAQHVILPASEIYQLGFRICEEMAHEKIYAVDWMGDIGNRSIGDVLEWAKANQTDMYDLITGFYIPQITPELKGLSIVERLKHINQKERLHVEHELYLHIAQISDGTNHIGVDWVSWWYQRNLIIFNNIMKLAENTEDRILVLIGGAHVHLLSQFLTESGSADVEKVEDYLS
ncbi:DUF5694 domain-containing protein [Salipaludibacillus aurantiacus]|uniref:TraB family protein n=1 Tax=Salipaludibacillus aurantiacus TaxID=1601833 RepID=A0A1H9S7T7_9BACI|nr:DUF5694 domain-containing protein [Salipaludibacillus aurantiacus]SER80249.1 hypothetical protein SAMN05518684_10437 [Salipaludibacillus aurantiacus]